MRVWRRQATRRIPADLGFTLVEVIVSLVLLTMVMVGVATLFMRSVKQSSSFDRRQAAVAVAGQSMELARSIPASQDSNGNSKLVTGRYQSTVHTQFTSLAATVDLTETDEAYDTTATVSSTPVLPYAATATVSGITYTTQRIVGSCWRPSAGGACVKAASKAASSQFMYRVIVQVTWSEGNGTGCSGGGCEYELATLVDPTADPTFNINATNATWPAPPVLNAITATTSMGTPVTVDLSTAVATGATPMNAAVGSVDQGASASVLPNTTQVTVTPAGGFWSGADITVPFTLTDPYGQSGSATLTVHVNPPAPPVAGAGSVSTAVGTPISVNLASYVTGGTGALTYSRGAPTSGSLGAVSGSTVVFTPAPGWYGTATFTYTVSDTYGQSSSNTISVTVPNPCGAVPTAVQDGSSSSAFITVANWAVVPVNVLVNDTLPTPCGANTVSIVSATSNSSRGSASMSGGWVWFAAGGSDGTVYFTYRITNNLGTSDTVRVYVRVI